MPSSLRLRLHPALACLALALALSGCGGKDKSEDNASIAMKDLETADGTINDSMTDLDGIQSEGTAMAPAYNDSAPAAPAEKADNAAESGTGPSADETATDSEVVSDQ